MNSMEMWKVMQSLENPELGEIEIKRSIFLRRFFIPFSVHFRIDSFKLEFKKSKSTILVCSKQRED